MSLITFSKRSKENNNKKTVIKTQVPILPNITGTNKNTLKINQRKPPKQKNH